MLGTWQAIYLIEHRDRPHSREIVLHYVGSKRTVARAVARAQRSFRVARPTSASTTEMIQKRTTTVDSCQPFCSK